MKAQIFESRKKPLVLKDVPVPKVKKNQLLIKVEACGLCRTDLHILDGDLIPPKKPLILGHQIVGIVTKLGSKSSSFNVGDRVGAGWVAKTCGQCTYCKKETENLCEHAEFTGFSIDGGLAEYTAVYEDFVYPLPKDVPASALAPLLCPGLIGYRAHKMIKGAKTVGYMGFGAAAHLLVQVATSEGQRVFSFVNPSSKETRSIEAKELGSAWTGPSTEEPPEKLDALIIFAPVGDLVPKALSYIKKGGSVILAGIHMSEIPAFPYSLIYDERSLKSVANTTRKEGKEFLQLAEKLPVRTFTKIYTLEEANKAFTNMKNGDIHGSAVIVL